MGWREVKRRSREPAGRPRADQVRENVECSSQPSRLCPLWVQPLPTLPNLPQPLWQPPLSFREPPQCPEPHARLACSPLAPLIPPASLPQLKTKLSPGPALSCSSQTPGLIRTPEQEAGLRVSQKLKRVPTVTTQTVGDSVAARRTGPANLAAPCQWEPSPVGLAPSWGSHPALYN